MPIYVLCFVVGFSVGLRSMTAPAVVSWGARLGWINLHDTALEFLGSALVPWLFTIAAVGELIADKLPTAPSRKALPGFLARVVLGILCGAAVGAAWQAPGIGLIAGLAGAVAGTFGGYAARTRLARALRHDLPVALAEDLVAIGLALLAVRAVGG
jgi:uncharacterized membrane protein